MNRILLRYVDMEAGYGGVANTDAYKEFDNYDALVLFVSQWFKKNEIVSIWGTYHSDANDVLRDAANL